MCVNRIGTDERLKRRIADSRCPFGTDFNQKWLGDRKAKVAGQARGDHFARQICHSFVAATRKFRDHFDGFARLQLTNEEEGLRAARVSFADKFNWGNASEHYLFSPPT